VSQPGLADLAGWITEAGLAGQSEPAILDGFCRRAIQAGCPIARAGIVIDTLHPVLEGRAFRWRGDGAEDDRTEVIEYGPSDEGEIAETWRRSVFFHMLDAGLSLYRCRIAAGQSAEFPAIAAWRDEGMTDYLALIARFAA